MGCFDSVCSISRAPISAGDDIVAVYVAQQRQGTFWEPISFPFYGTYNDYGDIEDFDEDGYAAQEFNALLNTEKMQEILKPLSSFSPRSKREMIVRGRYPLPDSMVNSCYLDSTNELVLKEPPSYAPDRKEYEFKTRNSSEMSYILIHRKVWDHLVSLGKNTKYGWGKDAPTIEDKLNDIDDLIDQLYEETHKREDLIGKYLDFDMAVYSNNILEMLISLNRSCGPDFMMHCVRMKYRTAFQEAIINGDKEAAKAAIANMFEMVYTNFGMDKIQANYTPYMGHSSEQHQQIDGCNNMINFYQTCIDLQKEKIAKIEECENE